MSRSRRTKVPAEEKTRLVPAALAGDDLRGSSAPLRCHHGDDDQMEASVPRRRQLENKQLKLALAEATVQLRIWQRGAALIDQVPSTTSKP